MNTLYLASYTLSSIGLLVIIKTLYYSRSNPLYQLESGEYDFLSDESSLQSRLDLAQAYLEMNQNQSARQILKQLSHSSDINIREKAIQALDNI
ncbi:hypothetical protein OAT84_01785 [Gammaproteobacteria bacterium]|nr:hypothetical protein [Gammaproteobacteria bacterium]